MVDATLCAKPSTTGHIIIRLTISTAVYVCHTLTVVVMHYFSIVHVIWEDLKVMPSVN